MSEHPPQLGGPTSQPAGERGGDMAGRLGQDVGRFAALAMRRLEQMASVGAAMAAQAMARPVTSAGTVVQTGADRPDADTPGRSTPDAPAPGSATARAEAMVEGASAPLGALATLAGHHLRRAAALAREEAEDVWVEAQQIRAAQRRDPN